MTIDVINDETWMDTDDLCAITGWAKNTIEGRRSRGEDLPPCYRFGKRIRYKLSEVNAWIDRKRLIPSSVQLAEARA